MLINCYISLKSKKKFLVVIRGLHLETDIYNIKCKLSELGHFVHVTNVQINRKNNPNNKGSYVSFETECS